MTVFSRRARAETAGTAEPAVAWPVQRVLVLAGAPLFVFLHAEHTGYDVLRFFTVDVEPVVFVLAGAALLLARHRAWTYALSGLLIIALPLAALLFLGAADRLLNPFRGMETVTGWLVLLLVLLVGPAAASGFVAARRGSLRPLDPQVLRTRDGLYASLAVAFVAGAIVTSALATQGVAALDAGAAFDVTPDRRLDVAMQDFAFTPATLEVRAGEVVEVTLRNRDPTFHTFTYERDGILYDHFVPAEATTSFMARFDAPGTIRYWCTPHSTGPADDGSGMVGAWQVAAAGGP